MPPKEDMMSKTDDPELGKPPVSRTAAGLPKRVPFSGPHPGDHGRGVTPTPPPPPPPHPPLPPRPPLPPPPPPPPPPTPSHHPHPDVTSFAYPPLFLR